MDDTCPAKGLTIRQLLHALREQFASIVQKETPGVALEEARRYEEGIKDVLIHARYLVNSLHITAQVPPEVLSMICSHLSTEDVFSASQVCRRWRGVLISSPSLWTRLSCHHVLRTIASLERCESVPIRLKFDPQSSMAALENVPLHRNEIVSLTVHRNANQMPPLHELIASSMPSLERLHIYSDNAQGQEGEEQRMDDIWQDFPSLRELFICRFPVPISQFAIPNLVHLALENVGEEQEVAIGSILEMLRGCPLLETVLIIHTHAPSQETAIDHSPVSLQNLRSIELGVYEVHSGLITYLQFPPSVAAGFRSLERSDVAGGAVPPAVMASSQHVLGRIDIRTITLAIAAPHLGGSLSSLVRFEGVDGSLEITFKCRFLEEMPVFFFRDGVLFTFAPRLDNVKELQFAECLIFPVSGLGHIATAMPNLTSICLFHCEHSKKHDMFDFMSLRDLDSSLPFPHLERLTVLGPGPGLIGASRGRKRLGEPLQTVIIGPEPDLYTPEQIAELREFVDEVRVEIPPDISEWSAWNGVLEAWSEIGIPGPDTLTSLRGTFRYCRFNSRERFRE